MDTAAASSSSSSGAAAAAAASATSGGGAAAAAQSDTAPAASEARTEARATDSAASTAVRPAAAPKSRGIELITSSEGDLLGFSVSQAAQLYATIDQILASPRLLALPVAQRYALAGKVAAVPSEHGRVIEKLASHMATSVSEVGALNALYVMETCKELVPGFKEAVPADRLQKAAELSPHGRVQAAIMLGQKPEEWDKALKADAPSVVLMPQDTDLLDLEDKGIIYDAGRAVGDATKLVGGAAFGGVGVVTDTLGLTDGAEEGLATAAEDVVDAVGDGVNDVLETLDEGFDGTAEDVKRKGIAGAVGDGMADAMDLVTDFVGDAVHGIAGGVHATLDWVANNDSGRNGARGVNVPQTHKVAIVVGELFGEERSLGLRIESRMITKFTKPEAAKLGWQLGDCIVGVGSKLVMTQEAMLEEIKTGKEAMKASGAPLRFLVERLGDRPAAARKKGDLVFVGGRPARIQEFEQQTGMMKVQFQDDGTVARVASP